MFRTIIKVTALFHVTNTKSEASYMELLSALANFRTSMINLLQKVDTDVAATEHKGKATEFSDKWLSILGISTGLTGIVRDLIMNYIGRDRFHDNNGKLIKSIRDLRDFLPGEIEDGQFKDNLIKHYVGVLRNIPKHGLPIFDEGPVNNFLQELNSLLEKDIIANSFAKHIEDQSDSELKIILELLDHPSYARPTTGRGEEL